MRRPRGAALGENDQCRRRARADGTRKTPARGVGEALAAEVDPPAQDRRGLPVLHAAIVRAARSRALPARGFMAAAAGVGTIARGVTGVRRPTGVAPSWASRFGGRVPCRN